MKEDFSELISYLDERFNKIESALENKADKNDVLELTNAIDALVKKIDTSFQEFAMLSNKVNRLEQWIREASQKIGIEFND